MTAYAAPITEVSNNARKHPFARQGLFACPLASGSRETAASQSQLVRAVRTRRFRQCQCCCYFTFHVQCCKRYAQISRASHSLQARISTLLPLDQESPAAVKLAGHSAHPHYHPERMSCKSGSSLERADSQHEALRRQLLELSSEEKCRAHTFLQSICQAPKYQEQTDRRNMNMAHCSYSWPS